MRKEIARIQSTSLGFEGHGIFTAVLNVDYGGSNQGLGGHNLVRIVNNYIPAVLRACCVSRWEDLPGRTIFVLFAPEDAGGFRPLGIEPLPMDGGERMLFSDFIAAV